MRRTPALIAGGGPAGATLALLLARGGSPHLLVERTRETGDALCGGFLSWRTLATLDRLGIAGEALNPATVRRVRLFAGGRRVEAPLPRPARAVSRRRLDTVLTQTALAAGARIERGVGVRAIDGLAARLDDGAEIAADTLFLATGKHDTRGLPRPPAGPGEDRAVGLRVRLAAGPAVDALVGDAIELHLFDRSYVGLVRQEDGSGNFCLAVRRSRLREAGDPERLLAEMARESPALGERLARRTGAVDAVANVPYGWRATDTVPGVFRLGDQAAVIPSLAGEGLGIAVASAIAAAAAYGRGDAPAAFQRRFARTARRPVGIAAAVWHAAETPALAAAALRLPALARLALPLLARATRIDAPLSS